MNPHNFILAETQGELFVLIIRFFVEKSDSNDNFLAVNR
ncbi:hypothetical protein EJK51_1178 [Moraxella catarrhalis]|nr:hypothetical protein EJK52_1180 [Moraxella catarrhalis]AZQ91080.1 hypothetical protein EJK51_1178 [Moraxella catarrhalis]